MAEPDAGLTEKELMDVAKELRTNEIHPLGTSLGLTSAQIDEIKDDSSNVREQKFGLLIKWKQQNGSAATKRKLAESLRGIGNTELAATVYDPAEELNAPPRDDDPAEELNAPPRDDGAVGRESFVFSLLKLIMTVTASIVLKFCIDHFELDASLFNGIPVSSVIIPVFSLSAIWVLFPSLRVVIQGLTACFNYLKSLR